MTRAWTAAYTNHAAIFAQREMDHPSRSTRFHHSEIVCYTKRDVYDAPVKPLLSVSNLGKRYGAVEAVRGVSFTVERGTCFGLLGPNGAGKTSILHMIGGILTPDWGTLSLSVSDHNRLTRKHIGVATQTLSLYGSLSAEENLRFFGRLHGLSGKQLEIRVTWCLELARLTTRRRQWVSQFSGGMCQRLNLAVALIHQPDLVLLDEPTVGVDPQSRNHLFDMVEDLVAQGLTVLYTTHYMEEAQRLCHRLAIVDEGRIVANDSVVDLLQAHGGKPVVEMTLAEPPPQPASLPGSLEGLQLRIETETPAQVVHDLVQLGVAYTEVQIHQPNLESVFLSLTGRRLRD